MSKNIKNVDSTPQGANPQQTPRPNQADVFNSQLKGLEKLIVKNMQKETVGTAVPQNDATHKGAIKFNPNGTICIRATLDNPARALQYMVDGLEHQDKRDDFEIDMHTYGAKQPSSETYYGYVSNLEICYGCAATCTIQEIAKKNLTYENIGDDEIFDRARALNFSKGELCKFENAIDNARNGNLYPLYEFFNIYNTKEEFYKDIIFKFSDVLLIRTELSNIGKDFFNAITDYELDTENWRENLYLYKDLILLLIKCNPNWK